MIVLHVENSATVRAALRTHLRRRVQHVDVVGVRTIAEARVALSLLADADVRLVVLDWSLPDGTAAELEEELGRRGLRRIIVTSSPKSVDNALIPAWNVFDKASPTWMSRVVERVMG